MKLFDHVDVSDFKFAASQILILIQAAQRLQGGQDLADVAQVAVGLDEDLAYLEVNGIESDLELAKRVDAMSSTLYELLQQKRELVSDSLVADLLQMTIYSVSELDNDWDVQVMEGVSALLSR